MTLLQLVNIEYISVLINVPPINNYQLWMVHYYSAEINVQARMANYLERRIVIRAKIEGVERC